MTDADTASRERPDFGLERGRNLVYVGRNTTIADVVRHIDEQDAEIAALREAVRDIDSFIGTSAENQLREWHRWEKLPAVRRAREEKP